MTARRGPARRKASEAEAWRECAEWVDADRFAMRSVYLAPSMTRVLNRRVRWHCTGLNASRVDAYAVLQSAKRLRNWRVILCLLMALECEAESRSLPARSRK